MLVAQTLREVAAVADTNRIDSSIDLDLDNFQTRLEEAVLRSLEQVPSCTVDVLEEPKDAIAAGKGNLHLDRLNGNLYVYLDCSRNHLKGLGGGCRFESERQEERVEKEVLR